MLGRDYARIGGSMLRSKILLVGVTLIPATILATGYSSLGEAKGDECRAKPDSSAPAGLHWYYRVDQANNRHCWYLHEQGMRVHSVINATSRSPDTQSDPAEERIWKTPVTDSPQPEFEQNETTAEQPALDFAARWVDLPRSADLNAHELVAESNGYAAERGVENRQEQLPPALANGSAVNGDVRQNAAAKTNFGSISLAGAVVLALLLMTEALIRFAGTFGWRLLRRHRRLDWGDRGRTERSESAADAHNTIRRRTPEFEPISRTQAGVDELRSMLQRAGAGLRPPQSFAPSRPVHRHQHANRPRAHSTFERLKSRSFNGMTWAPL